MQEIWPEAPPLRSKDNHPPAPRGRVCIAAPCLRYSATMKKIAASLLSLFSCFLLLAQDGKKNDQPFRFQSDWRVPAPGKPVPGMAGHGQHRGRQRRDSGPSSGCTTSRDRDAVHPPVLAAARPHAGDRGQRVPREIETRFRHVNQFFGRGTPRPGWMTAMGRIYMILGEPNSTESFDNVSEVYPAQVWYYYGDHETRLAGLLQRHLLQAVWEPANGCSWTRRATGPTALLVNSDRYASSDSGQIYRLLQDKAPTLAGPAFSMVARPALRRLRPFPARRPGHGQHLPLAPALHQYRLCRRFPQVQGLRRRRFVDPLHRERPRPGRREGRPVGLQYRRLFASSPRNCPSTSRPRTTAIPSPST